MTKSGKYYIFLGLAQALHSSEEIYFHLYDFASRVALKAPPIISVFSQLKMKSEIFTILNIIIIVIIFVSVPFYENKYRWAVLVAWFCAIVEILNGLGHLTVAIIFSHYFPGSFSAPLLILSGLILLRQLNHERKEA